LLGADTIQHRPDSVLEKYKIKYVLFPPADTKNKLLAAGDLVYVLEHDSRWKVLYKDKVCELLEKQSNAPFPALGK
jgi:hypothetical protein